MQNIPSFLSCVQPIRQQNEGCHTYSMDIIFSAVVSLLVQVLKKYMPNEYFVLGLVAVLSIVAAGAYTALVSADLWQSALHILTISGAIYTFIIQRFESSSTPALD